MAKYIKSVLELLEERAVKDPDRIAFKDPTSQISFKDLCDGAKAAGTYFSNLISHRDGVAFYMEKSTASVKAMFGVVYAGGFYSYIDVRQPAERISRILQKLDPGIVITDSVNLEKVKESNIFEGIKVLMIEDLLKEKTVDEERLSKIRMNAYDTDPLYVNFTSGSTGTPKGVTVSHRSVIEFSGYFTEIFDITKDDIMANQAPFDFDVSVKDIYSSLTTGAEVLLIPRDYFSNPTILMDYLADNNVTVLVWAVSAMCFVSIMNGLEYRTPSSIRMIMFSGEVMPVKHLNKWKSFLPDARYVNLYGPTEITCNCTYHILDREYDLTETIPTGIPFPNEKVFLLDDNDREVTEPDTEGEICVAGTCLALGYYNDREKTDASFVRNPLNTSYEETIYRTGDLGRYDKDGLLYYTSRKDFQIKHMGQRIELGEIDNCAMAIIGVLRACTIYDSDKKKIKLFYEGDADKKDLFAALKEALPPYMVPSNVKQLEHLPVNKNGKIDRTVLAAM
ncbi:MAG: amino acid adenylation domain-containing protein [Lachnospiraceae bacterium]|nr:amino acid adenylation domain-containing protein [Lachnospiraceae bacterium]